MRYTIENNYLKAIISDQGAALVSFIDLKTNTDIVLGYDSDQEYLDNYSDYFGATVGRNANRIGNACFILNDKEYHLNKNDGLNNLHGGGINGFSFKKWKVEEYTIESITLSYYSKDTEEGFPGNLKTQVTYKLEDNNLIFSFNGTSDQDTLFNITNHSYFNLGDENILNHNLYINTSKYSPTDENALSLDFVEDTTDTAYDFSTKKRIGDNISKLENGIDNNYVWEVMDDKLMCELSFNNIKLSVYSDLPDMHVYTGYHLENKKGKNNKIYNRFAGIALECQYYPNGINYGDKFILPILKKNEIMKHYIRYEIEEVKNGI